jgi:transposase
VSESMRIAQLLGLAGVEVDTVEREADGSWTAHVTTAPGQLVHCPNCGAQAGPAKEPSAHTFAHLAVVPLRVTWHKRRLWCADNDCQTEAFAESGPTARARAAVSEPGRVAMGHLVGDWMVPVCQVAAAAGVSWHTAHEGFIGVADQAGIRAVSRQGGAAAAVGRRRRCRRAWWR